MKLWKKKHFDVKKRLIAHSLLEKMAVENSKIQISIGSRTLQGKDFQLKFGTYAYNEVFLQIGATDFSYLIKK